MATRLMLRLTSNTSFNQKLIEPLLNKELLIDTKSLWVIQFRSEQTGSYIALVFENNFPFRQAELTFSDYTKADAFVSYELRQTERLTVMLFGGVESVFNQKVLREWFPCAASLRPRWCER